MQVKNLLIDNYNFSLFYLRGQIVKNGVNFSKLQNPIYEQLDFSGGLDKIAVYICEESVKIYKVDFPVLDIPFTEKNYLFVAWITKDNSEKKSLVAIRNLTETYTYVHSGNIDSLTRIDEILEMDLVNTAKFNTRNTKKHIKKNGNLQLGYFSLD